jgi:peptidoglycan L-alanyl-D-glutamate endopeptidase CwlK
MFKLSDKSEQILNTVKKELGILAREVIKETPYDFAVVEGFRGIETQQKYFEDGKSKCDGINKRSKHQDGDAIDINIYIPFKDMSSEEQKIIRETFAKPGKNTGKPIFNENRSYITFEHKYYIEVANIFKKKAEELNKTRNEDEKINIRWGGDFKDFFDGVHFELV